MAMIKYPDLSLLPPFQEDPSLKDLGLIKRLPDLLLDLFHHFHLHLRRRFPHLHRRFLINYHLHHIRNQIILTSFLRLLLHLPLLD